MNHYEIVVCCIKNQLWPSSTHFVIYYFSKLPSAAISPVSTTCIISDDVIEKLLAQANLFWDNWIVIKLNLLYAKLDSSSSSQSKDTAEADLPLPFPKTKFKKPTWKRPILSVSMCSSMTPLKLLSSIFTGAILYIFTEISWIWVIFHDPTHTFWSKV